MNEKVNDFNAYRAKMNERILSSENKVMQRFFNLDTNTYLAGAVDTKTKEMLGLVASLVLRCDDCINYHLIKCHENQVSEAELFEVLNVGLVAGGSIVIPHLRRGIEFWDALQEK